MVQIQRTELKDLIERREGTCVSISLPTHRSGPEIQQDPIRLKNLGREAEKQLVESGIRPGEVDRMMQPVLGLVSDIEFWKHRTEGLALYVAKDYFRQFDLPFHCHELVVVADRFHVKPIVPLLFQNTRFILLALSQNEVRVFDCDRYGIKETVVEGMPTVLEEFLATVEGEKQIQYHSGTSATRGGKRAAVFHGQGGGADESKTRLLEFCQAIDRALHKLIAGEQAPLVLAGVKYLQAIYREANNHPHLAARGLDGNWEGVAAEKLHRQAWEIVGPQFDRYRTETLARYKKLSGSQDSRSSNVLDEILPAAHQGRVETLFAAEGHRLWGQYDPETGRLEKHDELEVGDEDLCDLAVAYALANGGDAYVIPPALMPDAAVVAAIFRY